MPPCRGKGGRCNVVFEQTYYVRKGEQRPHKTCPRCRAACAKSEKRPCVKEYRKGYWKSAQGKAVRAKHNSANFKVTKSNAGKYLMFNMGTTICNMIAGRWDESAKVKEITGFKNAEDCMNHFRSTYAEGMTDANHGRKGWNVGHRIAKALYDANSKDDMQRCWHRNNLYAQWELENQQLGTKLPVNVDELKHIWPLSWGGVLPS